MSERVHVNIRIRPPNATELEKGSECVAVTDDEEIKIGDKRFTFDYVFTQDRTQEEVYFKIGVPIVESVLKGYNGTVMAYGQTGSGKTHTMTGPDGGINSLNSPDRGLVPRVILETFSKLAGLPAAEISTTVHLSILELYKEQLNDLLCTQKTDLKIREDRLSGRGVYIEGAEQVGVSSADEALGTIEQAMQKKQIASTSANETSSRSHTIVTLTVTQTDHVQGDSKTTGRLYLVDLAGSERVEKSGAEGNRLKEAQTINLSLTLLGNVINKLTDGKSVHIPYRDAKLTRILQDSFGGNSRTVLLCNVSPSSYNSQESTSTLQFANRAKEIKNKPRVNKELTGEELKLAYQKAQEEISACKVRIANLEEQLAVPRPGSMPHRRSFRNSETNSPTAAAAVNNQNNTAEIDELKAEISSLMRELDERKEELYEMIKECNINKDRAQFYETREHAAVTRSQELKQKYDRERMAAESWMRKYNELKDSKQPAKNTTPQVKKKQPPRRASSSSRKSSVASASSAAAAKKSSDQISEYEEQIAALRESEEQSLVKERLASAKIDELLNDIVQQNTKQKDTERQLREAISANTLLDSSIEKMQAVS
eukprot:TRINITY_DN10333_c0_g1_i1.p1 TRINITY_DN10333_c0_g1~~TRINITY_DN10333_c0_g1_i1.p1  ORF type:complete len:599 (+),score=133.34 TRINITY_DN10333_c0_g1_i1:838-2634(+)